MQIKVQKWGNSCALRLNKDLLQLMSVEAGSVLDVEVKDKMLVLKTPEPKYTLDQLLSKSRKENFALSDEDREWLDAGPAGKEAI